MRRRPQSHTVRLAEAGPYCVPPMRSLRPVPNRRLGSPPNWTYAHGWAGPRESARAFGSPPGPSLWALHSKYGFGVRRVPAVVAGVNGEAHRPSVSCAMGVAWLEPPTGGLAVEPPSPDKADMLD